MKYAKICFLVSGNGGTLKFINESIQRFALKMEICGVVADRACGALDYANQQEIPTHEIQYTRKNPEDLRNSLKSLGADVVITNIHKIIDANTLSISDSRFINLHYSLLPAFGGLIGMETLKAARNKNAQFVGVSCHEVVAEVDAGQLIGQAVLPVNWNDQGESELTPILFRAACLVCLNSLLEITQGSPGEKTIFVDFYDQVICFNPGLLFPISSFDQDFWAKIESL